MLCLSIILLSWCTELCNKSEKTITETFWIRTVRTCVWTWVDKIEWYAECTSLSWHVYNWDVRWSHFNWKWKLTTSNWVIQEWYFYNWYFVAWKQTESNGNATKWLWSLQSGNRTLEFWKEFRKSDWTIWLWDFDDNWQITYWLIYRNVLSYPIYFVGNSSPTKKDWYFVSSIWCAKYWPDGWFKEITRTVTNTVYRNIWRTNTNNLWTLLNPYVVNLNVKTGY